MEIFSLLEKIQLKKLDFNVDIADGQRVAGWIWRPDTPTQRVVIELLSGGKVVAEATADQFRQDLADAGKSDGHCAFDIKLPALLETGKTHAVSLRVRGIPKPFFDYTVELDEAETIDIATPETKVDFNVEIADKRRVAGWIWRPDTPTQRVVIELLSGGKVVAEATADQFRQDLADAGKSDGGCAFSLDLPELLRDGWAHHLSLRIKGEPEPFIDLGHHSLVIPRYAFDQCTPFEIAGTCWVPYHDRAGVRIVIRLGKVILHDADTDDLNGFSCLVSWNTFSSLLETIGLKESLETNLVIEANGFEIRNETVSIILAETGKFAFFVEEFSLDRLVAQALVDSDLDFDGIRLYLDGRLAEEWRCDGLCDIAVDFGPLKLADGDHQVAIATVALDGKETFQYERVLRYYRWDLQIDIADDRVTGTVVDRWAGGQEPAIELLVDGRALGVTTARLPANADDSAYHFDFPISARFRDGRPHMVGARVVGTDRVWPERGLLFQVGDPVQNALKRVECLADGAITGFALAPWSPHTPVKIELRSGMRVLEACQADEPCPVLAAEQVLPERCGFRFDPPQDADSALRVVGYCQGEKILDVPVSCTGSDPFRVEDPGHSHSGICFVLGDPYESVEYLEETRSILLAAVSLVRASNVPVTIILAQRKAKRYRATSLEDLIISLVGREQAQVLSNARFVYLPEPVVDPGIAGAQYTAYCLDLWVRACAFSLILGPSRKGLMAYCAQSRREGLLSRQTTIAVLITGFVVEDTLVAEYLLDDPELLNFEALERLALRSADHVLAHHKHALKIVRKILPEAVERTVLLASESAAMEPIPLGRTYDPEARWIVVAGPLSTSTGVGVMCDALDRLARQMGKTSPSIGVLFVGAEGNVQTEPAGDYIRKRAKKWPFNLVVHVDLSFDSVAQVLADFAGTDCGVVLQGVNGSAWADLMESAGIETVLSPSYEDNPSVLADSLRDFITSRIGTAETQADAPDLPVIGAHLAEIVEGGQEDVEGFADADLPPLSVCISHFNRPSLLRQALLSLRACHYPDLETIVVDDGSTAFGVQEELTRIAEEFEDLGVKLVNQTNSYLGAARNTAVRNATGEFIVFMDDDNIARPGMLHGFVAVQRSTGADIVTSRFAFFDETDDIDPAKTIPSKLGVPMTPDLAVGVFANSFGDANMLVRRSAFEKVGGFTEDFGVGHEDWEFFAKAQMLGLRQSLSNRVLFHYRVGAQSMLRGRERVERDLLRNIRAYAEGQRPELYRIALLAQGLLNRWDRAPGAVPKPVRPGLAVARRLAFGRVAVIMRTKDRPILLQRAIDSVLGQTFSDWTLVIVNDGGDPAPVRALLDARRHALQGRALLINNPTSTGMENASNAGITNSSSEFVVVHDDDDAWDPSFLEKCVAHLDSAPPEVGGVVTHATVVIEDIEGDQVIERQRFLFKDMEAVELSKLSVENQFPPISFIFRRSVMDTVGLFDGELPVLGDWDFHLRVAERYRLDVLREPLAFYHHRTAGTENQYGNTVVAQKDVHRIQRAHYVNRHLRASLTKNGDGGDGQLLYLGELHREVSGNFQDVREHMHWIEKLLEDRAEHLRFIETLLANQDRQMGEIERLIKARLGEHGG